LLISCYNSDEIVEDTQQSASLDMFNKSYIENATLEEKLDYKRFHLKNIANWLSNNYDLVRLQVKILKKGNDLDETFFVEDIFIDVMGRNKEITTDLEGMEFSLRAFENLEKESWYPTIAFHNYEKYNSRTPYDSLMPLFAIDDYDINNQQQIMVGYQEDANGDLEEIDEVLSEALAGEEDIIILEMLPCAPGGGNQEGFPCGGGATNPPIDNPRSIKDMTVKYHKEGWPGRSEVNLIGFKLFELPFENGFCGVNILGSSNCIDSPNGKMISQYKRSWISNQTQRREDYLVDAFENDPNFQVFYSYVIFEQDSWPAPKRTEDFNYPSGHIRSVKYRSWQDFYDKRTLSDSPNNHGIPWMSGFSVDINAIEYDFYTY